MFHVQEYHARRRLSLPVVHDILNRSMDKVAIVTAGGGGIGRAVAGRLARTGAAVLIGDKSLANAADATREIEAAGGRAQAVEMDLGRAEDARRIVDRAVETF